MAKKKLNPKLIVGYLICAFAFCALVVFVAAGQKKEEKYFTIALKNEGSTYQTKLEAYKAKQAEEIKGSVSIKSSAYGDLAVSLDDESKIGESAIAKAAVTEPSEKVTASEKKINTNVFASSQKQVTQITRKIKEPDVKDEEYEVLEQDIKNYYGGGRGKSTKDPEPQMTERERRKAAMESSWGQVGTSSAKENTVPGKTLKGAVYGTQEIRRNQTARFRTTEDAEINGVKVPKNTIINGVVTINQNRLNVQINSIRIANEILPVRMQMYGSDGVQGIPLDVDITSKTAGNEATEEALNQAKEITSRTGLIGRTIGNMATTVVKATKSEKDVSVTLLDNQMVIFKIN